MRKFVTLLVVVLFAAPFCSALLISFEEFYPGPQQSQIEISNGYMGMNWSEYFLAMTADSYPGSGYQNGATGTMTAYTSEHAEVSMSSSDGTAFDFIGADITAGRLDGISVIVEGWRLGQLIYSQTVTTSTDGPYPFVFNFTNVDTVWFKPPQRDNDYHIAIDNIEIAPEPATLLLFGLGGLALIRKRK